MIMKPRRVGAHLRRRRAEHLLRHHLYFDPVG